MKMKTTMIVNALALLIALLAGCSRLSTSDLKLGGIYSVVNGEDDFGVVKILTVQEDILHIRLYQNRFKERPATLDLETLVVGSRFQAGGPFDIGRLPVRRSEFLGWKPQFVIQTEVTADELNGSRRWQQADGSIQGK